MKPQYKFFSDPGHGWLEVPMAQVRKAGIQNKVSGYSYRKTIGNVEYAYLEEDCDAGLFVNTIGQENMDVVFINLDNEAAIRNYPRF